MTKDKTQTIMEKYLGQRLGFRRVIDSFVNKLEEAKEEEDLENIETFIEKVEEKVVISLKHQRKDPFAHRRRRHA